MCCRVSARLRIPGLPSSPAVPPACLLDPSLGSHEYVTANGIKFHYVAAGDRTKPLMLLVHGFPEVRGIGAVCVTIVSYPDRVFAPVERSGYASSNLGASVEILM